MTLDNAKTVAFLGLLGIGAYLVWKTFSGISEFGKNVVAEADKIVDGFVKVPPPETGTIPQWISTRSIDPLILYFSKTGNTESALAEARKAGWTREEINYAVSAWAANERVKRGEWY